jgi:hypothetical protein
MQLSLVSEFPELEKKVFLDIFAKSFHDTKRGKIRLKTINGQTIPTDMSVGCATKVLNHFPEGTIFKLDARLIQKQGMKPYFITIKKEKVMRALEFFDHNIEVEKGIIIKRKKKTVTKVKK